MKKRLAALLLAVCLFASLCAVPASASASVTDDTVIRTVQALDIMVGDENGDMNLTGYVTRAQFAKLLVATSSYKDNVATSGSGYSLYTDVKNTHWASEYIRIAAAEGWMIGYTNGSFQPDATITLEEACTAVLRLLGYDVSSLSGSYPSAQLNKSDAVGLLDDMERSQGEKMTRMDSARLFYNALVSDNSSGVVYATTLGYTVTSGEVDYNTVVQDNLKGPYIATSSTTLSFTPTTIYRDDEVSSSATLSVNDVYYYNAQVKTLWIYTEKVSGKVDSLSPSSSSPTSVTISGKTYSIGSSEAAYQLSSLSGGSTDTYVTLLLGMDDAVAGVLTGDSVNKTYYGVVQSATRSAKDSLNEADTELALTVYCTDDEAYTFILTGSSATYSAGSLVSVKVTGSGLTVNRLSDKRITGKVNSSATKLGTYTFADDVEVLDTSTGGAAAVVDVERLAGCNFDAKQVRYYTLNSSGQIDRLILDDVTGDAWDFAYMTRATSGSYTYIDEGTSKTFTTSDTYAIETGGIAIRYDSDGQIKTIRQLEAIRLTDVDSQNAMSDNRSYEIDEDVQIYIRTTGSDAGYYLTQASEINANDYTITGWYDDFGNLAGGLIRIIIAVPN
ncbi:MAG: S-layer homology domain-containing protein [Oscillospiraceae bacterium]|nr:S-layer homology domain-containing protein [Oscillospiraceae bacterium]